VGSSEWTACTFLASVFVDGHPYVIYPVSRMIDVDRIRAAAETGATARPADTNDFPSRRAAEARMPAADRQLKVRGFFAAAWRWTRRSCGAA